MYDLSKTLSLSPHYPTETSKLVRGIVDGDGCVISSSNLGPLDHIRYVAELAYELASKGLTVNVILAYKFSSIDTCREAYDALIRLLVMEHPTAVTVRKPDENEGIFILCMIPEPGPR